MKANERRIPKRWTKEEDRILYEETQKQESAGDTKDWHRIATKLPGRTNKDCRKRWVNKVRGGLKKGAWNESEDNRLLEAVQKHSQRWTLVANDVGFRSPDQCAKRWQLKLDPNLEHRGWAVEEDELLLQLVRDHGREWKMFQGQSFPGKSTNELKNREASVDSSGSSTSSNSGSEEGEGPPSDDFSKATTVESIDFQCTAEDITMEWMRSLDDPSMWSNCFDPNCDQTQEYLAPDWDMLDQATMGDFNSDVLQKNSRLSNALCCPQIPTSRMAAPELESAILFSSPSDSITQAMENILFDASSTQIMAGGKIDSTTVLGSMFGKVVLTIDECSRGTLDAMLDLAESNKGKSKLEII
ncbi:hypothetical protein F5Y16DRAFT_412151 [Xylariaceae sp. FL0255]|nr:hypothetical protein F5Y16DRAFT_412151 [Xylariaceae sp. FL0255]